MTKACYKLEFLNPVTVILRRDCKKNYIELIQNEFKFQFKTCNFL